MCVLSHLFFKKAKCPPRARRPFSPQHHISGWASRSSEYFEGEDWMSFEWVYLWKGTEEHGINLLCCNLHGNIDLTVVWLGSVAALLKLDWLVGCFFLFFLFWLGVKPVENFCCNQLKNAKGRHPSFPTYASVLSALTHSKCIICWKIHHYYICLEMCCLTVFQVVY